MKRTLKKLAALASAAIMTLGMVTTAFAATVESGGAETDYTLSVESQNSYDTALTYNVYQLFTCDINKDNVPVYTADGSAASILGTTTVADIEAMDEFGLFNLASSISTSGVTAYYSNFTTGDTLTNVAAGYYLLVPTGTAATSTDETAGGVVSAPIFVAVPEITQDATSKEYTVKKEVVVESKVTSTSTDKKITDVTSNVSTNYDDTFSGSGSTATAGQNDTITYTITNTVPKYKSDVDQSKVKYVVTDTYDENLTLGTVTVTTPSGLNLGTAIDTTKTMTTMSGATYTYYTITGGDYYIAYDADAHTFTVYFDYSKIASQTEVVITATFTQKASAVPGTAINNTSELKYTNNYYTGQDSTLKDKVKSYTFGLVVYKYDKETEKALSGAKFGLYSNFSCEDQYLIAEVISGQDGVVDFGVDLNAGTYYIKETEAPAGYRIDTEVHTVVIGAATDNNEYTGGATFTVDGKEIGQAVSSTLTPSDNLYTVDIKYGTAVAVYGVANTAGTVLPGTGGIGTTLFTFGGLALVILAAIMFIVYSRKQRKQA